MEDTILRGRFQKALESVVSRIKKDLKCIAAYLIGSMSHDVIWEWSDLSILAVYDDSYKGATNYTLLEQDVFTTISIRKKSEFKAYLGSTNISDFYFCALSKSTLLFMKDPALKDYVEDIFYIGDREREVEMLLGFSQAVYYLNKVEKNYYVMKNSEHALFFLYELALGIAWIEVSRHRLIPEREIIAQAKSLKPELFRKIYDSLYYEQVDDVLIEDIIHTHNTYLKENTLEVYRPVISYLREHGSLKDFSMNTRQHGFGINFEWLYKMGIVERTVEPIKINNQQEEFYKLGYRLNPKNK